MLHPRAHAFTDPDKPALILADQGQHLDYAALVHRADRAAELFRRLGLKQGDTIAVLLENHLRYSELCWAAKNSGITYACISSQSSVADAAYIVDNSDAKLLISSAALSEIAVPVAEAAGARLQGLMLDQAVAPFQSYEDLLADTPPLIPVGRRRGPSMLYSSGTTGRPKGIRISLPEEAPEVPPRRFAMLQERYGFNSDMVLVCPGPLYHAGPGRFMMSVQRAGGTVVSFRRFDAEGLLAAVARYRATHLLVVPTMFIRLLELPLDVRRRYRLDTLRCVIHLGSPCPIPVKEQMIDWLGPIIEELYGGTEAVGHTLINSHEWLAHRGSVGKPAAGCQIRIVDEQGQTLPAHQPGLVYMTNGNRFEYHKDPEKTRSVLRDDGWGTLGDIGYLDDEGFLYLTDRQSHMIISGGVNIYPQEAENLLYAHPEIADVAVIGVPHPQFGETVKAVVQPQQFPVADPRALEADIIAYCAARLSRIKCPRSVDFVASLPRNEAGKLIKHRIKAPYWEGHDRLIG